MASVSSATAPDAAARLIEALPSVTASELKNNFGAVSGRALKGALAILRHRRPEFVLLPVDQYVELQEARTAPLEELGAQFDALVARMNTAEAKRGVDRLFGAKPAALGRAAVKAAKTDGR